MNVMLNFLRQNTSFDIIIVIRNNGISLKNVFFLVIFFDNNTKYFILYP